MFVAGAPDPGEYRPYYLGFWGRIGAGFLPGSLWSRSGMAHREPPPGAWHVPGDMLMSVELVEREAARLHLPLRVIDVNQPEDDRALVEHYVRPDDVLPFLVRSDNDRLSGFEEFTPETVRRFLSHH